MPSKKREFDKKLIFLIIAIVILSVLIFKKPAITGQAILSQENIHSDSLNLKVNESGTYEWQGKKPRKIKKPKTTRPL